MILKRAHISVECRFRDQNIEKDTNHFFVLLIYQLFDTDSSTRFPCRPYNDGATWMTLFFMRTSILYPFFEGAIIKPSIMLNSLKFIYFVRCLLSVLKVNCKIIIDLYQKPPEKNHKTVDPE